MFLKQVRYTDSAIARRFIRARLIYKFHHSQTFVDDDRVVVYSQINIFKIEDTPDVTIILLIYIESEATTLLRMCFLKR